MKRALKFIAYSAGWIAGPVTMGFLLWQVEFHFTSYGDAARLIYFALCALWGFFYTRWACDRQASSNQAKLGQAA